jgi:16S rRNA (guanine966-N2)-methyltransferase
MRIISGTAGNIAIKVPPAVTRPTTDRVREAVFSMIADFVEGSCVLDLFAGSGAMGLEALSRGAEKAVFVEQHSGACEVIQENLRHARLLGGRTIKGEALASLRRLSEAGERFNVIFADPPYAKKPGDTDYAQQLLSNAHLRGALVPRGLFVLETMVTKHDSGAIAGWDVLRDRAYGSTRILILQDPTSHHVEGLRAVDLQPAPASGPPRDGAWSMEEDAATRGAGI